MKKFFIGSIIVIASLFVKLSASDFKVTTIGESGVGDPKIFLSYDQKFIYLNNSGGQFRTFSLDSMKVVDSMKVCSQSWNWQDPYIRFNYFAVSPDNKYLYITSEQFHIYDLVTHKMIKIIDPKIVYEVNTGEYRDYFFVYGNIIFDTLSQSLFLSFWYDKFNSYGSRRKAGCLYGYDILKDSIYHHLLDKTEGAYSSVQFTNDKKTFVATQDNYYGWKNGSDVQVNLSIYNTEDQSIIFKKSARSYGIYASIDNANKNVYYNLDDGTFEIYSIPENKIVHSEKRKFLFDNYIFFKNNSFYATFNPGSPRAFIFDKENHQIVATYDFPNKIYDMKISHDSTFLYATLINGRIYKLEHAFLSVEDKLFFSANQTNIQTGDSVRISDCSIGNFDSRTWKINGVEIADTSKNICLPFFEPGYYSVELIKHRGGISSSLKRDSLFRVWERVVAEFKYNIINLTDSTITIQLENLSKGEELDYKWYFGDGTSSTEVSPTKQYKKGYYSIALIAKNSLWSDSTFSKDYIRFGAFRSLPEITTKTNRKNPKYNTDDFMGIFGKFFDDENLSINYIAGDIHTDNQYYYYVQYSICFNIISNDGKLIRSNALDAYEFDHGNIYTYFKDYFMDTYLMNEHSVVICEGSFLGRCKFHIYSIDSNKYYEVSSLNNNANIYFNKNARVSKQSDSTFLVATSFVNSDTLDKTFFVKLNTKGEILSTDSLDFKSEFFISDTDRNTMKVVRTNGTDATVGEYSTDTKYKQIFTLIGFDRIDFADIRYDRMLFVKLRPEDTLYQYAITNMKGDVLFSGIFPKMPILNDIKLSKDYVLMVSNSFARLYSYDFNNDVFLTYLDSEIEGSLRSIDVKENNVALLVGSILTSKFKYFDIEQVGNFLYYVINLDDKTNSAHYEPIITNANLTIYPNPATEAITIKFDNDENQTSSVTIYNSLGLVEAKFASNENIIKVPTAGFAVGTYYVVVSIGNSTISGKFAVVR